MTTQYYITYQIKKSNCVSAWHSSKIVETEEDARKMYKKKLTDTRVRDIRLWKIDTYKPEEVKNWQHSHNIRIFHIIDSYTVM